MVRSIIDMIVSDPGVSPGVQRVLDTRHTKQERRKMLATPETVTGFGDLRTREERSADAAYDFREMQDADRRLET